MPRVYGRSGFLQLTSISNGQIGPSAKTLRSRLYRVVERSAQKHLDMFEEVTENWYYGGPNWGVRRTAKVKTTGDVGFEVYIDDTERIEKIFNWLDYGTDVRYAWMTTKGVGDYYRQRKTSPARFGSRASLRGGAWGANSNWNSRDSVSKIDVENPAAADGIEPRNWSLVIRDLGRDEFINDVFDAIY